jgi:hypothetical protein
VSRSGDGEYRVTVRLYQVGEYYLYVAHKNVYDPLSEYPIDLSIQPGVQIGVRSSLVLTTTPWYAGKTPATLLLIGVDDYGNHLTSGGHAEQIRVTTTPVTVREPQFRVQGFGFWV